MEPCQILETEPTRDEGSTGQAITSTRSTLLKYFRAHRGVKRVFHLIHGNHKEHDKQYSNGRRQQAIYQPSAFNLSALTIRSITLS